MKVNKEESIRFAGLMEDFLNIPSFVCEMIQQQLEENKYKEVIEYVVQRRNEIESKPDFISDRNAITMLVNQNEQKDKEIKRLQKIAHKMHLWIFLHSEDEQKVYDELGLTDEENAMLGYSGQFRIGGDEE